VVKKRFRVIIEDEIYEVEVEVEEGLSDIEMLLNALERGEIHESSSEVSYSFKQLSSQNKNVIISPISGKVVEIKVSAGDEIKENTIVAILEAMKTQVEIKAGKDGKVKSILVKEGDVVKQGQTLIVLA